ncbi:MAG: ABC transporter ATP-binding protein [Alcaligenaceae bacterium]
MNKQHVLELKSVYASYGRVNVLQDLSFKVEHGEAVGILGRNGVGKTTTLKTIMGLLACAQGSISFDSQELSTLAPHKIPHLGIGYVPQGRGIFPNLSVKENLFLGVKNKAPDDLVAYVFERFPRLRERLEQPGGTLSGGEQQMLSIARCLLMEPKLIILDEPTEGIMPKLVSEIRAEIKKINAQGIGILLVEQNVKTALDLCTRILVMDKGKIVMNASTQSILTDPKMLSEHLDIKI